MNRMWVIKAILMRSQTKMTSKTELFSNQVGLAREGNVRILENWIAIKANLKQLLLSSCLMNSNTDIYEPQRVSFREKLQSQSLRTRGGGGTNKSLWLVGWRIGKSMKT